jgi:hypothetical protein
LQQQGATDPHNRMPVHPSSSTLTGSTRNHWVLDWSYAEILLQLQSTKATRDNVQAALQAWTIDSTVEHWGGTGNYSEYFLMIDDQTVRADFDRFDQLLGYDVSLTGLSNIAS